MHICVLGGCGFIGRAVSERLHRDGHWVRVVDREEVISIVAKHEKFCNEFFAANVNNVCEVLNAVHGADVVLHFVHSSLPKSSVSDPVFDCESNVVSSVRLFQSLKNIKRVVFLSSGGTIYGDSEKQTISENDPTLPIVPYGISKLAIENYIRYFSHANGYSYTIVRLSNPFGPGQRPSTNQGVISVWLDRIIKGQDVEVWGDGSITRDYLFIDDVANFFSKLITSSNVFGIFNLGSGVAISHNDIIRSFKDLGIDFKVNFSAGRNFDIKRNVLCIDRAKRVLGWSPEFSFQEGVEVFYRYLLNRRL